MGPRHAAAATTVALVGALLAASPAEARPAGDRVADRPSAVRVVRAGDHFPATVTTDVPPGGTSMLTTPTLSSGVTSLTVTVQPKNADATQADTYDRFVNTIGTLTKGQRLLVCTMMYQSLVTPQDATTGEFEVDGFFATLAGAVLVACLQLAGLLTAPQPARAAAAGGKCGQIRPNLSATVQKVAGGYSVQASGSSTANAKPKIKVKCRVTGDKVRYTIRAAKKGQSLRKAAGKKLSVGLKSPSDAVTSVPVQVTFSTS